MDFFAFFVIIFTTPVAAELPYNVLEAPLTISMDSIISIFNKLMSKSLSILEGSETLIPSIRIRT